MGEWKAQISLRVKQDLRRNLEAFAERDRRKLGNLTELLVEGNVNIFEQFDSRKHVVSWWKAIWLRLQPWKWKEIVPGLFYRRSK